MIDEKDFNKKREKDFLKVLLIGERYTILEKGELLFQVKKDNNYTLKELSEYVELSVSVCSTYINVFKNKDKLQDLKKKYNLTSHNLRNIVKNSSEHIEAVIEYCQENKLPLTTKNIKTVNAELRDKYKIKEHFNVFLDECFIEVRRYQKVFKKYPELLNGWEKTRIKSLIEHLEMIK